MSPFLLWEFLFLFLPILLDFENCNLKCFLLLCYAYSHLQKEASVMYR